MSNELQLAEKLPITSMDDIKALGEYFSRSGILEGANPATGLMVCAHCHTKGISILDFVRDHDVIHGKVCKKTHAMVADFMEAGGVCSIISRTSEECEIELTINKKSLKDKITWEEVKDEAYTKKKDGGGYKDNWSTPRRRKQMLYVRLISDMIRTLAPNVCRDNASEDFEKEPEKNVTQSKPTPMAAEKIKIIIQDAEIVQEEKKPFPERFPIKDEVDPFDKAVESYESCPIPGKLLGMKWTAMPLENLRIAEKMTHETLLAGHYKAINAAIKIKELEKLEQLP